MSEMKEYVEENMEKLIEKSVIGFSGRNLLEGYYQNRSYIAKLIEGKIWLYSNEPIASDSRRKNDMCYVTEFNWEEVDDLIRTKVYAVYKGNKYEVESVDSRLERLELLARKGKENEDLKLGFKDDVYERVTYKFITKDEIEKIYVEKESVYKEFFEKYANK